MNDRTSQRVDVAVVGGGPAGAAAALTLLRHTELSVALVERTRYAGWRVGETLSPGTRPLLAYLDALDVLSGDEHRLSLGTSAAWGTDALASTDFVFSSEGPGRHLDRQRFDVALAGLVDRRGGRVYAGVRVRGAARGADGAWRLQLSAGVTPADVLHARHVIDATGRSAVIARRHGARRVVDDRLVGVVGVYRAGTHELGEATTLVESEPQGWWYATPLSDGRLVVAYMSDADLVRAGHLRDPAVWSTRLQRTHHVRARVAGAALAAPLVVRPAFSQRLLPVAGDGWIAAGDAAVAFDPLSSMGIGYALASGIEAARVVDAARRSTRDPHRSFAAAIERHYASYRASQSAYYALERRWPQFEFWMRRHAQPAGADRPLAMSRGPRG